MTATRISKQAAAAIEQVFVSLPQAYVGGVLDGDQFERAVDAAALKLKRHLDPEQRLRVYQAISWVLWPEDGEPVWFS